VSYQVLARRFRPLTFDTVVGQGPIVRTLQNALARERIAHAYLFTGPRGVGKTTTARLLAMGLACERAGGDSPVPCAACPSCREIVAGRALDVLEIDGASNRGIDEVRQLRENARYAPARGRRKVYIIDEVHMLTEPAFNALLKTLEEPPAHVVFVLATTEPRRLPATILSRCQRFDFRPIAPAEIHAGLAKILEDERAAGGGGHVEPAALALIARAADGSLRDALSLLDTALAYGQGEVSVTAVRELLGKAGSAAARELATALVRRDAGVALGRIEAAAAEGQDLGLLCQDAMEILRRALLDRVAPGVVADLDAEETARQAELQTEGAEDLLLLVKGLLDTEAEMRRSPYPRVDLEVAVVRLTRRPRTASIETVLERLERAEAQLRGHGPGPAVAPAQADLLDRSPEALPPAAAPLPVPRPPLRRPPAPAPGPARPAPAPPPAPGAAPSPGSSPADDTPAPVAPAREVEAVWRQIVEEVTRVRPLLGRLLADAVVLSEEDGRLSVAVPNGSAFAQDQIRSRDNRQLLVDTAQRLRPGTRDVVVTAGAARPGPGAAVTEHPAVQAAVTLFEGEVVAVQPVEPRERRTTSGEGSGEGT
jgi:DNA polymerase-3 subunit gamma/tau